MKKHFKSLTTMAYSAFSVHVPPPDLIYRLNPKRVFFNKKNIDEVKSPHEEKIFVRRPKKELRARLKRMREAGPQHLQIITDFDNTISPRTVNGAKCLPTMEIFTASERTSPEYKKLVKDLFDYYFPREIDTTLPFLERVQLLIEWIKKEGDALAKENLTIEEAELIMAESNLAMREDFSKLVDIIMDQDLKCFVLSAGVVDVIHWYFDNIREDWRTHPNFYTIGNSLRISPEGKITGFEKPYILSASKKELLRSEHHDHRKNLILMGDLPTDATMANAIEHDNKITIGFLNELVDEKIHHYLDNFDIVIGHDGSFKSVVLLMNYLIGDQNGVKEYENYLKKHPEFARILDI